MIFKILKRFCLFTSCIFLALAFFACKSNTQSNAPYIKTEGLVWNTSYHITYQSSINLDDSIISVLNAVGNSLSVFDPNSLVSLVNRQDSTPVNTDFIRVYVMSRKINKASDGAFDPTLAPLIKAWGFGEGHKVSVDTLQIDSLLMHTGIQHTRLSHDALIKEVPGIEFNFSAIAKGYGCDRIAEMFKSNNVDNFLIEIGGEIAAAGKNPEGSDWKVSIDKPIPDKDSPKHESQFIISLSDMGMATSGNYRNYHSANGNTFGHIISSKTGRPVTSEVISATVVSTTAMEADALATALMSMQKNEAIEFAKKLRMPILLIFKDGYLWKSENFDELITK